jgi:hypothetical protein
MQPNSFRLSGTKASLEQLREALAAEPQAASLIISDPAADPEPATPTEVRVRQPWELAEAIWLVVITFPIGVAAEVAGKRLDDWLRQWLRVRADEAQVRVQEIPAPSAPDEKGETSP